MRRRLWVDKLSRGRSVVEMMALHEPGVPKLKLESIRQGQSCRNGPSLDALAKSYPKRSWHN